MDMHNSQPSTGTIALGETPGHDPVSNPKHYQGNGIEVIQVIEGWRLGPHLANAIKYVLRYPEKGGIQDLEKAKWYLARAKNFYGPLRINAPPAGPSIDAVIQAFNPSTHISKAITAISCASGVPVVAQDSWLDTAIDAIDAEIADLTRTVSGGAG